MADEATDDLGNTVDLAKLITSQANFISYHSCCDGVFMVCVWLFSLKYSVSCFQFFCSISSRLLGESHALPAPARARPCSSLTSCQPHKFSLSYYYSYSVCIRPKS